MSHDPRAVVDNVMAHAVARLEERLAEIERNKAKAKRLLVAMRDEEQIVRKALSKLEYTRQVGTKGKLSPRILEVLKDGPLDKDQLSQTLDLNGNKRQLHGSLTALVRHGKLRRDGDRFELVST